MNRSDRLNEIKKKIIQLDDLLNRGDIRAFNFLLSLLQQEILRYNRTYPIPLIHTIFTIQNNNKITTYSSFSASILKQIKNLE